ncbi:DsbA family oxidoreductase [Aquirufa beregesia]
MKIEIWSDIMCPFCYIGKRYLEKALEQFESSTPIEIEWKSYQLDPSIPMHFDEPVNVYEYLADRKGISVEKSKEIHQQVADMAEKVGLNYQFDRMVVANSLKAHQLIQLAKEQKKDNEIEEKLFEAYFVAGKNLSSESDLVAIGESVGLEKGAILAALENDELAYRVRQDTQEGISLGLKGVPFFVFNRRYGIPGAQPLQVFIDTLRQAAEHD